MSDSITRSLLREIEPLRSGETVASAARKVIDSGLPALPVVDAEGSFAGVFGEREFIQALFPGYLETLGSARMVSRTLDETIERRLNCAAEPIAGHLTTDHVLVDDDSSDMAVAETFLHHRVLIVPFASGGRVHALVTRSEFFRALAERLAGHAEDAGVEIEDVGT